MAPRNCCTLPLRD